MKLSTTHEFTIRRGGFTLVEILVSATITIIILAALITITSGVADTWSRTNSKIETGVEGRVAFEVLTRDLQSALLKLGGTGGESLQVAYDPGSGDSTKIGKSAWLTFFAPPPDRDLADPGDICALSYRISYRDPIASAGSNHYPIFALYRATASAEETFENILGKANLMEDYWIPNEESSSAPEQFLCAHVVDFKVAVWYRDPTTGLIDVIQGDKTVRIAEAIESPALTTPIPRGAIDSIEVTLSVLSEQGARLAEDGASPLADLIRLHGSTYTRRIGLGR